MSLIGFFKGTGPNGFGHNSSAEDVTSGLDLSGKTYLLTGCNSGIGQETARVLGLRGARVIGAARTLEKATAACADFGPEAVPVACELSDPSSVRAAVQTVRDLGHPLDGILCNAGIMALPKRELQHGYEAQFFTNHVGHFILVTGLLDQLTPEGRVVMTSSSAHTGSYSGGIRFDDLGADNGYSAWGAYGQSKLANVLFATHLATKLKPGQTANAIHPGVIVTNLGRHMNIVARTLFPLFSPIFLKSVPQGAATQTLVATHPSAASQTGLYWADCNPTKSSAHGRDAVMAETLWTKTEAIVAGLEA
jgi:NAD(P)-dependent dehydrogenase (short-subunit alcohol dehydrogenase family)